MSFSIHDPAGRRLRRRARAQRTQPSAIHMLVGSRPGRGGADKRIVLITATVQSGKIVMLRRLHSR